MTVSEERIKETDNLVTLIEAQQSKIEALEKKIEELEAQVNGNPTTEP